ncbi:MAG: PepSY-associated TM helix domain-containing protein [Bacteroidota bacterium]
MESNDKRTHNVFFNLHTVSGIAISVGLFVIFLAGAFALFLEDINHWEKNKQHADHHYVAVDYDRILDSVATTDYELYDRTFFFYADSENCYISVNAQPVPADSTEKDSSILALSGPIALNFDMDTYQKVESKEREEGIGDFLYHLHYFEPIPVVGIYIAGLVAVFFLLAIVTGIWVHWKKIVSNFYTFRLKGSLKNLWTDAHTALGVIGLPFQLMYAVTGALFGLTILIFAPSMMILFDGDQEKMTSYVFPPYTPYEVTGELTTDDKQLSVNSVVDQYLSQFDRNDIHFVTLALQNYGDKNAHATVMVDSEAERSFYSNAYAIFRLSDGQIVREKPMDVNPHNESVVNFVHLIHFGNYGGYLIKILYFLLAIITCFVIISGVMVWLEARDKKKYAAKQRFNTNVGAIYLGACMGLYPAIAFLFCVTKILPLEMDSRMTAVTGSFFVFWLAYTVYAYFSKNYFHINRNALFAAGGLGLLIPILNGLQAGNWFWVAIAKGYSNSAFVDISWILLAVITLVTAWNIRPTTKPKDRQKVTRKRMALESPIVLPTEMPVVQAKVE